MNKDLKKCLNNVICTLETIVDTLQEKFDDSSESWQNSDKGDQCLDEISCINCVIDMLQQIE